MSSWVDSLTMPKIVAVEVVSIRTLRPRNATEWQQVADFARASISAGRKVKANKKALRNAIANGAR